MFSSHLIYCYSLQFSWLTEHHTKLATAKHNHLEEVQTFYPFTLIELVIELQSMNYEICPGT